LRFFEEYAFDSDRRELHRGRTSSPSPQVFDLLDYLIALERVVSKDDLINAVERSYRVGRRLRRERRPDCDRRFR
jgi:DNA-binding winged helix-turn-helix (wHTH) protein